MLFIIHLSKAGFTLLLDAAFSRGPDASLFSTSGPNSAKNSALKGSQRRTGLPCKLFQRHVDPVHISRIQFALV